MIKTGREYKIKKVNKGITKNGKSYTIIKINDNKRDDEGNWTSSNFAIFVLDDIDAYEGGTVNIPEINGVDYKVREYNGKTYSDCTLYANSVIVQGGFVDGGNVADPFANEEMPF